MLFDINHLLVSSESRMSIKDRIKFFQNLKTNEDPKTIPKPLLKTIDEKKIDPLKPVSDETIKPLGPKIQIKPHIQISPQQPSHEPLKLQMPKSAEVITQPHKYSLHDNTNPEKSVKKQESSVTKKQAPPVIKDQEIPAFRRQESPVIKKQESPLIKKQESHVMSVKQSTEMFQKNKFPLIQQPPTVMKSCFVPFKKSPFEEKSQGEKHNEELKPKQSRTSLPQKVQKNEGQKKLSFQEMRLIAEGLLKKTQAPPVKVHQPEPTEQNKHQQNHSLTQKQQNHPNPPHKIKVQLDQQTQTIQEHKKGQGETKTDTDSQILFKQAIKHQPETSNTLVTGQQTNLNLGVRKTAVKRRNNDDFDDL